jgi:hypothetical protein
MAKYDEARRKGLLRALAVVQRYQKENSRQSRVNDVCRDIKRLINEEVAAERTAASCSTRSGALAKSYPGSDL